MSGIETAELIEWRASPAWALKWIAVLVFVALPFLGLCAWLAAHEIAHAPAGTWPAYLVFLGLFATLILGVLTFSVLNGVRGLVGLLLQSEPVLRGDRHGLALRAPYLTRTVRWDEVKAIEIERTRKQGRYTVLTNHLVVRLRDAAAPSIEIKPQMAGLSLEAGQAALAAMHARFRQGA